VIYGIVKQHNGWVHVYSRVGNGVDLTVYLPAYVGEPERRRDRNRRPDCSPSRPRASAFSWLRTTPRCAPSPARTHRCRLRDRWLLMTAETGLSLFDRLNKAVSTVIFTDVVLPDRKRHRTGRKRSWPRNTGWPCCSHQRLHRRTLTLAAIDKKGFVFIQKPYTLSARSPAHHPAASLTAGRRPSHPDTATPRCVIWSPQGYRLLPHAAQPWAANTND